MMYENIVETKPYTSLEGLAAETGLPRTWLRAEAEAGRIPSLNIGHRRVFDSDAVRAALDDRSAMGVAEPKRAAQPDPDPAPPACNTENTQSTEDLLLDLWGLARHLKISLRWLRAECDAGRIPCLRAGKRRFFSLAAVREALVKRAADNAD
jgi:hypothetical protein